eukprot:5089951-Prymnesium_polylepis.1
MSQAARQEWGRLQRAESREQRGSGERKDHAVPFWFDPESPGVTPAAPLPAARRTPRASAPPARCARPRAPARARHVTRCEVTTRPNGM